MTGLRMYWYYILTSVKAQWQYRLNFALISGGVFLQNILDALALWALFDRFGALPGWTLPQALLLYGLVNTTFAVADAFWRGFDVMNRLIRDGLLDRMLLRPRSLMVQLLGYEFRINRVGRFLQGFLVMALAFAWGDIQWTWLRALMLPWAALNGLLLFGGMFVLQGALCFYSIESIEAVNAFSYGGVYFAGYPMEIYGKWFRALFTYLVPLAAVVYYPVCFIIGRGEASAAVAFAIPLAGAAFFGLALLVFYKVGLPAYQSTGT